MLAFITVDGDDYNDDDNDYGDHGDDCLKLLSLIFRSKCTKQLQNQCIVMFNNFIITNTRPTTTTNYRYKSLR